MSLAPECMETERVLLRRFVPGDGGKIFNAYGSDPEVARYMVWPVASKPENMEAFVTQNIAAFDAGTAYEYVIVQKSTKQIIGGCGMHRFYPKSGDHFVFGYCLSRSAWGQGFATEVVGALVNWFRSSPTVYRFAAQVDVENGASCKVLEKHGFSREGILHRWEVHPTLGAAPRDCVMYALFR